MNGQAAVTDDTTRMVLPVDIDTGHRVERYLFAALAVAYFAAGGIIGFALLELSSVVDHLNTEPICRRL